MCARVCSYRQQLITFYGRVYHYVLGVSFIMCCVINSKVTVSVMWTSVLLYIMTIFHHSSIYFEYNSSYILLCILHIHVHTLEV